MADDVLDALESLRYNHELLLKDKKTIETCFEQESVEKDRLEQILKSQTDALRAMLRNVRLQNRESVEALGTLCDRVTKIGGVDVLPALSILGWLLSWTLWLTLLQQAIARSQPSARTASWSPKYLPLWSKQTKSTASACVCWKSS